MLVCLLRTIGSLLDGSVAKLASASIASSRVSSGWFSRAFKTLLAISRESLLPGYEAPEAPSFIRLPNLTALTTARMAVD